MVYCTVQYSVSMIFVKYCTLWSVDDLLYSKVQCVNDIWYSTIHCGWSIVQCTVQYTEYSVCMIFGIVLYTVDDLLYSTVQYSTVFV